MNIQHKKMRPAPSASFITTGDDERLSSSLRHKRLLDLEDDEINGQLTEQDEDIRAKFETWIKMASDNKINTQNSWNSTLIDYFHDMNLLKEGNKINFQVASATLDGCMKVYTSRIDSAVSAAGSLLTGLAHGQDEGANGEDDPNNSDIEMADDEELQNSTPEFRKKSGKSKTYTLLPAEALKLKELDQELNLDPIFRKTLTDFDEGGAKSLLLNSLKTDYAGRVVFDTSAGAESGKSGSYREVEEMGQSQTTSHHGVDLSTIKGLLNPPDGSPFLELEVCPSLHQLEQVMNQTQTASDFRKIIQTSFTADSTGIDYQDENDELASLPDINYDLDSIPEFELADEPTEQKVPAERVLDNDVMDFFDASAKNDWEPKEHWKVKAVKQKEIKEKIKVEEDAAAASSRKTKTKAKEKPKTKKGAETVIDMLGEKPTPKSLFARAKALLPDAQFENDTKYLLPEEQQLYTSKLLVSQFLRPSHTISIFQKEMDVPSSYNMESASFLDMPDEDDEPYPLNPTSDFFSDVPGFDEEVAEKSRHEDAEEFIGTQSITHGKKARDDYMDYAKVAKRVDVSALKRKIWRNLEKSEMSNGDKQDFTNMVQEVAATYPDTKRKDLSTSYFFICLLHLANERGFDISNTSDFSDLFISKTY
ncbi:unnamed protein product [Kuraishia capsulata CBS 1993]|uniref:Condensin complex subunit 2 n=1 Tax=Kuraishia capsulata CBS 1993 TaxID=1382522 RepID=W6MXQ4_9ASCO|nr:uncharacterized protein KUCA_T00005283001 [Kuraishia capsulata CBS 1993]CDK29295.1 unnamed protein product [Kuraishia capsulata CBS 1993]